MWLCSTVLLPHPAILSTKLSRSQRFSFMLVHHWYHEMMCSQPINQGISFHFLKEKFSGWSQLQPSEGRISRYNIRDQRYPSSSCHHRCRGENLSFSEWVPFKLNTTLARGGRRRRRKGLERMIILIKHDNLLLIVNRRRSGLDDRLIVFRHSVKTVQCLEIPQKY